jgi:hypothetical protein
MSRVESHTTTDHDEIRRWCDERGGTPSGVTRTADERDRLASSDVEMSDSGHERRLPSLP